MMVYVDSSIILAELFSEDLRPAEALWSSQIITSRLSEYEVWNRANAYGFSQGAEASINAILDRFDFVELAPIMLARCKLPFSKPVRTLDALHLSTCDYLRHLGQNLVLASFDERMNAAAKSLGIPLYA